MIRARVARTEISLICCVAPIVSPVWPPSLRETKAVKTQPAPAETRSTKIAAAMPRCEAMKIRPISPPMRSAMVRAARSGAPTATATPFVRAGGRALQCQIMIDRLTEAAASIETAARLLSKRASAESDAARKAKDRTIATTP